MALKEFCFDAQPVQAAGIGPNPLSRCGEKGEHPLSRGEDMPVFDIPMLAEK